MSAALGLSEGMPVTVGGHSGVVTSVRQGGDGMTTDVLVTIFALPSEVRTGLPASGIPPRSELEWVMGVAEATRPSWETERERRRRDAAKQ